MMQFGNRSSVSTVLLVINLSVFVIQYMFPVVSIFLALSPMGLLRYRFFWTPVTYMFVHGGFTHLLFNMLFFLFVGPSIENRMGSKEFLVYYLITGLLAGLFSFFAYMAMGQNIMLVGASGALYGILLAYATYFPRAYLMIFYVIPMRAPYAILLFAGIDIFMQVRGTSGVANLTHLSGLIFGYLYFKVRLGMDPIKIMRNGN